MKKITRYKSHTYTTTFHQIPTLLAAFICLLVTSSSSFAADDNYLNSLEAESNNSSPTTSSGTGNNYLDELSAEAESSASISTNTQHDAAYNKRLKKMELFLKNNKPSTFKFYKKLSKKKQARIFERYAKDKSDTDTRLTHLKKLVMDAYFKK